MKILHSLSIGIFALGFTGNVSASLTAEWKFNETSGTTAYDSVGTVNGTLVGNASFTETGGPSGGGAVDISRGGYVNMGNNFPSTSTFSIEAWVKIAPGDTSGSMTVVSKLYGGISQGYFLAINNPDNPPYYPSNLEMFYSANGPFQAALGNVALDNGQWHELVGVYNNGAASIYVDGNLAGTGSTGYSNVSADFIVGGVGGAVVNGQPLGNYQGLISDVQIYNNALSGADVQALYQSFQTPIPIPSALWLFGSALVGFIGFNRKKTME